jgi:hypothetical protein
MVTCLVQQSSVVAAKKAWQQLLGPAPACHACACFIHVVRCPPQPLPQLQEPQSKQQMS